ncbi:MAG: OmpA family protein [Patescibacteria group bacterium]
MSFLQKLGIVPKVAFVLILVALGWYFQDSLLPYRKIREAAVPKAVELGSSEVGTNVATNVKVVLPTGRPATRNANKEIRLHVMKWSAQFGLFLANGGPVTLTDSTIGKRGAYLKLINEDDTNQMKNELTAFAKAWAENGGGGNPEAGVQAVIVMGDGGPAYIAQWNEVMRQICKDNKLPERDCEVVVAGAVGSSYGEDQVFVPVKWKDQPEMALGKNTENGGLIANYFWDGDHLLALFWAQVNGLKVNPDEKTWDPDAVNFLNSSDFLDAVEKYNTAYCEERVVIRNGKPTGEKKNVCVEAFASWSPADFNMAKGSRDTLVSAISTRENLNQMASTVLTIRGWSKQNVDSLSAIFAGTSEASDMIKSSDAALTRAAEMAVLVYKGQGGLAAQGTSEKPGWVQVYKSVRHRNKAGYDVQFGGSRVWNNADAMQYYGLDGGANIYAAVYEQYGAMIHDLAPTVIKKLQPVDEILELGALAKANEVLGVNAGKADVAAVSEGAVSEVVGNTSYAINFEVGSDRVLPSSFSTIEMIYRQLATGNLKADIVGHTDNTGSADLNRSLSFRRAESVKREILAIARGAIDTRRLNASGMGPDRPLSPEANQNLASERARNRRVEITIGR